MAGETPEKLDFEIEALDVINPTNESLDGLREEIRRGLHDNMQQVLEYCESNRVIFYTDWSTVLESGDEVAKDHFRTAMAMIMPKGSKEFIDNLEDGDADKIAMLDAIIRFLDARRERTLDFQENVTVLSEDIGEGFLGKTVEHIGDRFKENPLASTLAGVVLVWVAAKAWNKRVGADPENNKPGIPLFQWIVKGGAGLLAVNHFGGPIFNGQTLFQAVESSINGGEEEELLELAEDHLPDASEATRKQLRYMFAFANVPFKYLLKAYKLAKVRGGKTAGGEIDMNLLRKSIHSRYKKNLSQSVFKQSRGREFFRLMQDIVGPGPKAIEKAEKRYMPATGSWSTLRVLMDKYDKSPGLTEAADDAITGGGQAEEEPSGPEVATGLTTELSAAKGFDVLGVKVLDSADRDTQGKLAVRGFKIDYTRKVEKDGDLVTYTLKGVGAGGADLDVIVGVDPTSTEAAQQAVATQLEAHVLALMTAGLARVGAKPIVAPSELKWDSAKDTWEIIKYDPVDDKGHGVGRPTIPVKLSPGGSSVLFGSEGLTRAKFEEGLILEQLQSDLTTNTKVATFGFYDVTKGMSIHIVKIPDIRAAATGTPAALGEGTVEGAKFTFHWDATGSGEYIIDTFNITPAFAKKKREEMEKNPDLIDLFDRFEKAGINQPRWWKRALEFKKDQIFNGYEAALLAVNGQPDPLDKIQTVTSDTLGQVLRDMDSMPEDIILASDPASVEAEFLHYGHSPAYAQEFDGVMQKLKTNFDLEGLDNKWIYSDFQVEFVFDVMEVWYNHTKEFSEADPLDPVQKLYLEDLWRHFNGRLTLAQESGGERDARITKAELRAVLGELRNYKSYTDYESSNGLNAALEQQIPQLKVVKGQLNWTIRDHPTMSGHKQIVFDDAAKTTWDLKPNPSGQLELFTMSMTPQMIDLQVEYMAQQPAFVNAFDRLENIFASMDTHPWEKILDGEFEQAFDGAIAENRWQSLIAYKQREAKLDYRDRLLALSSVSPPPSTPAAWGIIKMNLGDYEALAQIIEREIHSKMTSTDEYTRERFDELYGYAQSANYKTDAYRISMMEMRDEIRVFDFNGLDSLDSRKAEDLMNLAMEIQYKHTGELDYISTWTDVEYNYFQYVHFSVMTMLRRAHEDNTLWDMLKQDKLIRREEIIDHLGLEIKSYDEFVADPGLFADPDFTYDVGVLRDRIKEEEDRRNFAQIHQELTDYSKAEWAKHRKPKSNKDRLKYHELAVENAVGFYAKAVFEKKITMTKAKDEIEKKVKKGAKKAESSIWDDDSWLPLI